MKKIAIAFTAMAALTGSAFAADMAPRYTKAPAPVVVAPSWTGFWISGGFGYGLAEYQHTENNVAAPFAQLGGPASSTDVGGKGWLGKVGLGYDYQFMGNFVVGAFADADWSNISGRYNINTLAVPAALVAGTQLTASYKNDYSWAVGGRVGYVALPGLLTYINAGYTEAHFKTSFVDTGGALPLATGIALDYTRGGYFVGGGTEYAVTQLPGLFWKNEVRFTSLNNKTSNAVCNVAVGCGTGLGPLFTQASRTYEQKATTELVYRFNWGGPVVAKY
jgi:outer membrane immunogenic protein